MYRRVELATALIVTVVLLAACARPATAPTIHPSAAKTVPANPELILLSTTTTRDTGILDALVQDFQQRTGYLVKPIVAGSGEVLQLGAKGEGDVLLTHSPAAEEDWMKAGNGMTRALVMHNDFILVGPAADPVKIKGLSVSDALKKIAAAKALFVSRGDQSGTNVKELSLWKAAGIDPNGQAWYQETGAGQGQTLNVAFEKAGYTLTDRGTFLALKQNLALELMVEKEAGLLNIYHVITVNPARSPKVNVEGAQAFAAFVVSPDAQALIRTFGVDKYGQPLFIPDSGKSEEQVMAGK